MRIQYITMLGNTPGHIQHWSQRQIAELVSEQCNIIKIHTPLPWMKILNSKLSVIAKRKLAEYRTPRAITDNFIELNRVLLAIQLWG